MDQSAEAEARSTQDSHLQVFTELSAQLSSLRVYLWSKDPLQTLSDLITKLETLFKSEDGKFKLHIRHKETKSILATVVIKDKTMGMRIRPGLTQYAALDKNTLLFRFTLDSQHLSVGQIVKSVQRISAYRGPPEVQTISCRQCQVTLSKEQANFRIKSAPSANWREIVGLWQCHDENFDQFFDLKTRQLRVPQNTLLFNFNRIETHQGTDFATSFPQVQLKEGKHLNCSGCEEIVGFVAPTNPLAISATSLVSSQRTEQDSRANQQDSMTYSLFTERLTQFSQERTDVNNFADRLKTCIYNHCIEDRQRNLALIAETAQECKIITIKPLSHQSYIIYNQVRDSESGKTPAPATFTEANKVLFSEISYDLSGAETQWAEGLIDFVKQISSVRRVTTSELEAIKQILKDGQSGIPKSLLSVMGLYQLTYLS